MEKFTNNLILIVDDNPYNIQILAALVTNCGYTVGIATDARQAYSFLERQNPALILLDIMMPDIDGYEACRTIKMNERFKDTPIIFLTAKNEKEDIVKGFEVGGVDYIVKPFNSAELKMRIATHLKQKNSFDDLAEVNAQLFAASEELTQITEYLEHANRALFESETKFKTISTSARDAIIMVNSNLEVSFWNPAAEKIFGFHENEILGKNPITMLISPQDAEIIKNRFQNFKSDSTNDSNGTTIEIKALRKDGNVFPVELSISSVSIKGKMNAIAIVRDISVRHQHEQQLTNYAAKLKELNATKDKFFSIIAHDLKSPFSGILGFTNLLINNIQEYDNEQIIEFASLIRQSGMNAYALLENLLEWSRNQTGKIDFAPRTYNFKAIFSDVMGIIETVSQNKNITIVPKLDSNIQVFGDKNMICTILRNLISNAIKYSFQNSDIEVVAKDTQQFIEISVKDFGIGISSQLKDNLFRIDSKQPSLEGTNGEKGTGLGLIICKEFVEKHNGKIWVDSNEKAGSTFTFTLPKDAVEKI